MDRTSTTSTENQTMRAFTGELAFCSNFHPSPIRYLGHEFPTVEHAFQYAKVTDATTRKAILQPGTTPGQAKRLGRKGCMRKDWDLQRVATMHEILRVKFAPGSELAEKLIATGDEELVEVNTWNDTFWGMCRGKGKNHLGRLLTEIRANLRRPQD